MTTIQLHCPILLPMETWASAQNHGPHATVQLLSHPPVASGWHGQVTSSISRYCSIAQYCHAEYVERRCSDRNRLAHTPQHILSKSLARESLEGLELFRLSLERLMVVYFRKYLHLCLARLLRDDCQARPEACRTHPE